jgi:hypothetical protein
MTVIVKAGGAGNGDFFTRAYSRVTHHWYRLHCFANGDLNTTTAQPRMSVDCRTLHTPVARVRYVATTGG